MPDLTDKTIRLYEDCPHCQGRGSHGNHTCGACSGKGTSTSHVKFSEMNKALQAIAEAAVKQILAERDEKTRVKDAEDYARISAELNPNNLPRCCICCRFKVVNEDYICDECYGGHAPSSEIDGPWIEWKHNE